MDGQDLNRDNKVNVSGKFCGVHGDGRLSGSRDGGHGDDDVDGEDIAVGRRGYVF